jgi:hypothetical protein
VQRRGKDVAEFKVKAGALIQLVQSNKLSQWSVLYFQKLFLETFLTAGEPSVGLFECLNDWNGEAS